MSLFLELLSELQNPEKTRNFNVFKNYSLTDFEAQIHRYQDLLKQSDSYNPFRFSVVGTNGKGSTSFYLSEIVRRSYPQNHIGLYTSPHLKSPFERIIADGLPITEQEADDIVQSLRKISDVHLRDLSYFECLTLLCFCFFQQKKCKFEVWEAGLGGRLDATKLANANVLILTKIGIDHSEILGNTPEEIAYEKIMIAGSKAKIVYSFPVSGSLKNRICEIAKSLHLEIKFFDDNGSLNYLESNFEFAKWVISDLKLMNSEKEILFSEMEMPKGRMELISKNPIIVFDPAHNPEAVHHTIHDVKRTFAWERASLLVGCLPDKDVLSIWREIQSVPWDKILLYEEAGFFVWSQIVTKEQGEILRSPEDLAKALGNLNSPLLALGSFRLYPILTSLYQNDVIL